ncbi:uncharacterized protein BJ171DRAFT_208697 [Polychytrium aggregatum]|uniref:uncharacterized protein n=1 Tax=Polychytrium aggregatum TaxID=110093 RepID=UPI0022FEE2B7|nr:uncharacterized protein BJ171DRAFT_208697 [Polychytrium aggregatum]KAI9208493.1 hypothetical protein BJ171DRAFT_208697 [Polychytrium aggregatum]
MAPETSATQPEPAGRYHDMGVAVGPELLQTISKSRVLMIGAGGIGCELLKNLVMSGFHNIEIVDLDTIDLSNLNRQFLFQKQHIQKSKAHTAREAALRFNPHVNITSHHASIFDPQFDVMWFKGFDLVLNALDNIEARRRVNLMCVSAGVSLIESGTAGFRGQTSVQIKGHSQCYDCRPHVAPKQIPFCTIRSTPSTPVHCVVWAKYLFSQVFGIDEDDIMDTTISDDNKEEIEKLNKETHELKLLLKTMGSEDFEQKLFQKIFGTDIQRLVDMDSLWKTRTKPTPLDYESIIGTTRQTRRRDSSQHLQAHLPKVGVARDHQVWTLRENFSVFLTSLHSLSARLLQDRADRPDSTLGFDKDDEEAMDFVTAACNLRCHVFSIPIQSRFSCKQMAGNIIAAVATTNAIAAGLMIIQAFNIINKDFNKCIDTTICYGGRLPRVLTADKPDKPNPDCGVCAHNHIILRVNTEKMILRDLVQLVLLGGSDDSADKSGLGLSGELALTSDTGALIYDLDFTDNEDKALEAVHITHHKFLTAVAEPDDQPDMNYIVSIAVAHDGALGATDFHIEGDRVLRLQHKRTAAGSAEKHSLENGAADNSQDAKRAKIESEIISVDDFYTIDD